MYTSESLTQSEVIETPRELDDIISDAVHHPATRGANLAEIG